MKFFSIIVFAVLGFSSLDAAAKEHLVSLYDLEQQLIESGFPPTAYDAPQALEMLEAVLATTYSRKPFKKVKSDFVDIFELDIEGLTYLNEMWRERDYYNRYSKIPISKDELVSRISFAELTDIELYVSTKRKKPPQILSIAFKSVVELPEGAEPEIEKIELAGGLVIEKMPGFYERFYVLAEREETPELVAALLLLMPKHESD